MHAPAMFFYSATYWLNTNILLHATGKAAFLLSMRHHGIIDRFSYGTDIQSRQRGGLPGQRS